MRLLVALIVLLGSAQASADTIYKYRDKQTGRDVFVNGLDRLPPQYRNQATVVAETPAKPDGPETAQPADHSDPPPSAPPTTQPTGPSMARQVRDLGSELRAALSGKSLWKDGGAVACELIDARLVAVSMRPLSPPERERLTRLLTSLLILGLVASLLAFTVWVVLIVSALRDRHFVWAACMVFVWPMGLLYLHLHTGKGRFAFKLACTAGMFFPVMVGLLGAWQLLTWLQGVLAARSGHF